MADDNASLCLVGGGKLRVRGAPAEVADVLGRAENGFVELVAHGGGPVFVNAALVIYVEPLRVI